MILDDGLSTSEHVEEDENYFISMTDMMVGVLFIFLIMLMLFALNFRKQTDISEERIVQLEQEEARLQEILGAERAQELRAFWLSELEEIDMEEVRRSLDFDDRSLIRVWNRLHRNRARRAAAGRSAMILNAGRGDELEIIPSKPRSKL